jgi:hypothetical protein
MFLLNFVWELGGKRRYELRRNGGEGKNGWLMTAIWMSKTPQFGRTSNSFFCYKILPTNTMIYHKKFPSLFSPPKLPTKQTLFGTRMTCSREIGATFLAARLTSLDRIHSRILIPHFFFKFLYAWFVAT